MPENSANEVYKNIKPLFLNVKREYYNDPKFGRQIGNIDAFLPPIVVGDKEIDVRIRFVFVVKWSETNPLETDAPTQHFYVSIRESDIGMPKGNSDLYDWESCKPVDDVSTCKMIEFAKSFASSFEKKKNVIIKLIQDGKKTKVIIQSFISKVLNDINNS